MRILFIGDVVGRTGCRIVQEQLPQFRRKNNIQNVIANGENAFRGKGLSREIADQLFGSGVDLISSGNHIWDQKAVFDFIDQEDRLIRPANYPAGVPGRGWTSCWVGSTGIQIALINLLGRVFLAEVDSPFAVLDRVLAEIPPEIKIRIVDFHAEATSEKLAMAYYAQGKISALLGTHTHVQTADEQILKDGLAYITDVGMTGALTSILGTKVEPVLYRFLTALPARFEPAEGPGQFNAVILEISESSGQTSKIERVNWKENL
ncbi:MAG: TIGR00282 family metallophosphoesterase [Negativicutes bacterium]|nr:TIGR00282 family metallophosphoesterase [Negativicutes bacterium]